MNIQALMKQAQTLQKDMLKAQEEIEKEIIIEENDVVKVKINGKKEVLSIEFLEKQIEDIEMAEDMLILCLNNAFKKVDDIKEKKMSKFNNMPGMF